MKNIIRKTVIFLLVCLLVLPLLGCGDSLYGQAENSTVAEEKREPVFLTYDPNGQPLYAHWSAKDGCWYLYITSGQDIEDVVVHCLNPVKKASDGKISETKDAVSEAFRKNGDKVKLTTEDGTVHKLIVMQSELPSMHIRLNDVTLDDVHENKDIKHKDNTVAILDPVNGNNLLVEDSVEVKGRGNSTWTFYEKKAYQIKFDEKTSILGMGAAKKWVLLANAGDDTMMRTQLVYRMASKMGMAYVPSLQYADLWIDGDYRGTYLVGDKIELGSTRLDLQEDSGALFEHDEGFYLEEDHWFYSTMMGRHFVLKEIVEEDDLVIANAMADFESDVDTLFSYLFTTPSSEVTLEELSTMIDVDSFIKYYLVNEYVMNREAFVSSFYWYTDGPDDVIHLGPIWDYDTCLGNEGSLNTERAGDRHELFCYLLAVPEFKERAEELKGQYLELLQSMTKDVDVVRNHIESSVKMNYSRWNVLGKPNPKGGLDFHTSFDKAVKFLREWLQGRETNFGIADCSSVTGKVSDDCLVMDLLFQTEQTYQTVEFAVYSLNQGMDDQQYYSAQQIEPGKWQYSVDLTNHNSSGQYAIYVFVNGDREQVLTSGCNYVEVARKYKDIIQLSLSENAMDLNISMSGLDQHENILYTVWSEENGQDDMKKFSATRNDAGAFSCAVPMEDHQTNGVVLVQAYAADGKTLISEERVHYGAVLMNSSAENSVFCLKNADSGEYLYTCNAEEGEQLLQNGWEYQGVSWITSDDGLPIYRVYNPNSDIRHYSGSMEEVTNLQDAGWHFEGIAWYFPPQGAPVYRLYDPDSDPRIHYYTPSEQERDALQAAGWRYEGVAWNATIGG